VKLLRAIQERQFERVGGRRTITVDVRLVAATNRDLETAVREGAFRLDLYHRLQVVEIVLPPLRQRRDDVPVLVDFLLADLEREHGRRLAFSREAMAFLARYDWPGNVRQLRNVLERLTVSHGNGPVCAEDLEWLPAATPPPCEAAPVVVPAREPEEDGDGEGSEEDRVREALERAGHVQARAARLLGMTVRQLRYRVAKFGIQVERF
jgi:Nif-specific regulatory protein